LHAGERAAIALALTLKSDFVLIDERIGTRVALEVGLRPTGTLGILDVAARRGIVDLKVAIDRLKATNFRYPSALMERLLAGDSG
jgi:predicted nucleic acid-binding protein